MSLTLHSLHSKKGARKNRKRVGRGLGSTGTYSGRGVKGQSARSGGRNKLTLKGVRPMMLSAPKSRGFVSSKPIPSTVNVSALNGAFQDGAVVTPDAILKAGLVSTIRHGVKVLGDGAIGIKLSVKQCAVSEGAKAKIEKAGGNVALAK